MSRRTFKADGQKQSLVEIADLSLTTLHEDMTRCPLLGVARRIQADQGSHLLWKSMSRRNRAGHRGKTNDRPLLPSGHNTISTLDALSRSLIPGLSQGCCVVTGTAFELPMVIQVDHLPSNRQPASEDVNLEKLWSEPTAEA